MSTVTPNLGLIKPGDSEYIDVADLNANFDTLDAAWLAQDIIRVTDSDPLDPVTAVSTGQIQFKDNSVWKGLDEVRLYNNSDALYCKDGVTTGLLMQNNQIKIVPVTWNNGVPAVGTTKGYIDANGDYHSANTSLETLRESVPQTATFSGILPSCGANEAGYTDIPVTIPQGYYLAGAISFSVTSTSYSPSIVRLVSSTSIRMEGRTFNAVNGGEAYVKVLFLIL